MNCKYLRRSISSVYLIMKTTFCKASQQHYLFYSTYFGKCYTRKKKLSGKTFKQKNEKKAYKNKIT